MATTPQSLTAKEEPGGPMHLGASQIWSEAYRTPHSLKQQFPVPKMGNVHQLPLDKCAPIGLVLSVSPQATQDILRGPLSGRHLLDGLIAEMAEKAKTFGRRDVRWVSWRIPHALLDNAETTELAYFMGRYFRLSSKVSSQYSVAFGCDQVCPERLALFKGLGFGSLELVVESTTDDDLLLHPPAKEHSLLSRIADYSQDYHYSQLNLRLERWVDDLPRFLNVVSRQGQRLPDTVTLGRACNSEFSRFLHTYHALRSSHYRVLGNDCFARPQSVLAQAQSQHQLSLTLEGFNAVNVKDVLGIGPGAASLAQRLRQVNPAGLNDYLSNSARPPATETTQEQPTRALLEELLCYHQIDLNYFTHRYQLSLKPLLVACWSQLEQSLGQKLFTVHRHHLRLTEAGVLNLSRLCQELIPHIA